MHHHRHLTRAARAVAAIVIALSAGGRLRAQAASQRAAWDALMVAPLGGLPPALTTRPGVQRDVEFSLRYGRWQFSRDDAAHDNVGFGADVPVRALHGNLGMTIAYVWPQCGSCVDWKAMDIDYEAVAISRRATALRRPVDATMRIRAAASIGMNTAEYQSTARSLGVTVPLGVGIPGDAGGYLDVAVVPGIGYGRLSGRDRVLGDARGLLGLAASWHAASGAGIYVGAQHVFLAGAPTQYGVGFSWTRNTRRAPP